jgi:hypothetical protein
VIRRFLLKLAGRINSALRPKQDHDLIARNNLLARLLREAQMSDSLRRESFLEMVSEMAEAVQMAGSGPWKVSPEVVKQTQILITAARDSFQHGISLREANPIAAQGAFGDIELALQNVEWRREINLSWLEFSRWGIQQIILISRLYWVKNPIIRRLIDVCAIYVFGRGFEVSSPDEDANDTLKAFFEENKATLGQIALADLERRKQYDGNLFFAFFTDKLNTGKVKVRTIDATEIQEIVCDPEDADTPWYYRREWTERIFDQTTGATRTETQGAWYPALKYSPDEKPDMIGGKPVQWDVPIHHRKCGQVAKWHFGCPPIYPALDWAKSAKNYLENVATTEKALSQFALTLTTKGGQQAMEGAKQQLGTTVGPDTSLWDTNPPAVAGAIFASGPGTQLQGFNRGRGADPEKVRRFFLMCCMVVGVPETFLADVSTGNLATATTLDRPTELAFLEKQEAWREDLTIIAKIVLQSSANASGGMLRERLLKRKIQPKSLPIREAARVQKNGKIVYEAAEKDTAVEVMVTFPAIREGDQQILMQALVLAATAGNTQGEFVGIDEKTFVERACEIIGVEDGNELAETLYPEASYDPDRTKEPEPEPQLTSPANGLPALPATQAVKKLAKAVEAWESRAQ